MNYFLKLFILSVCLSKALPLEANSGMQVRGIKEGYEIRVQLKPFKNSRVILAHYYGNGLLTDATIMLDDKSEGIFKGTSKLHEGIYVIYEESNRGGVDFLIDTNQHFSVMAEFRDYDQSIDFYNSAENELLKAYKQFMAFQEVDIINYREQLSVSTNLSDSSFYIRQLRLIDDSIQQFRDDLIAKFPGTFLSTLLLALKEPVVPEYLRNSKDSADSAAVKYYIKRHFWDGVSFWDGRLVYTPFLSSKIDKYFTEIVELEADSVIKQIDWMMSTAGANEKMTQLILEKLFFGTMYHRFKWQDAVFIHLFEKYIAQKSYPWLLPEDLKALTEHAYLLIANNKGTKAYEINLPGLDGQKKSLMADSSRYSLLCFWDVTCSHCRETLPVLDSIYRTKWGKKGLRIYAVSIESDGTRENWLTYIKENRLEDWTHVYNSIAIESEQAEKGEKLTRQLYNVWYFPTFYLLDQEKRFMAKKLSYNQIAELIDAITSD